jgi:hypothetical protein
MTHNFDMKVLIRMAYVVARKHAPLADFTVPYLLAGPNTNIIIGNTQCNQQ